MWKYTELVYFLSSLYYKTAAIDNIIIKSGNKGALAFIEQSDKATVYWTNIIVYFEEKVKVKDIIQTVINDDHRDNEYLKAILADENTPFKSPYSNTEIDKRPVVETTELEKLTQGKSTLLPISFLEKGIEKSKSVVRVVTKGSLGSGFLVNNKYFITNNHVISSDAIAADAVIQLGYQNNPDGALQPFQTVKLDPYSDKGFATSKENDWTIVKLKDFTDEMVKEYKFLNLSDIPVAKDDFVNIIQHPGGEVKQIALYHNLIVGADAQRIQYLTDTQPGSSGSPVFNTHWDLVALHHAGGKLNVIGSDKKELVNEGININLVREQIKNAGIQL